MTLSTDVIRGRIGRSGFLTGSLCWSLRDL